MECPAQEESSESPGGTSQNKISWIIFFIIYKFNIMEYLQNYMPDAVRVVCADDEADIRSWRFYIRKETRSCTYDDSLMTFLKVEGHFLETLEQNLTRHAMQPPFLSK